VLISKIILKNKKKYYFKTFLNQKKQFNTSKYPLNIQGVWGWICFSWLLLDRGGNWRRGWGWWGMWVEGHKLLSFPS
jgi:hypothetical protein